MTHQKGLAHVTVRGDALSSPDSLLSTKVSRLKFNKGLDVHSMGKSML